MKKISKLGKGLAVLLSAALLTAPLGAVGEKAKAKASGYTIRTEEGLRSASGLSAREWEDRFAAGVRAGLAAPVTGQALLAASPEARIYRQNGRIYMITGIRGLGKVKDAGDAARVMYSLLGLLEAAEGADLRLWSVLTAGEETAYVFQQVSGGLTVVGSTARLVAGADGEVHSVFSSLAAALPGEAGEAEVTAAEAEECVRRKLAEEGFNDSVLPEYTTKAIVPVEDEEYADAQVIPDRLVWVVYSRNPAFGAGTGTDLPYLAHFVGTDGSHLRALAVKVPGDRAVRAGYSAAYAFEFMQGDTWTGEVTDVLGNTRELTVPVMRDTRTGVWYLADPERRIAVGDFYSLAYGDETVSLVSGTDNDSWRADDLITYANMIRVWDYYAALGWMGPDGTGTPVLLLRDLCLEDGSVYSNAAYAGLSDGWQCFAYGGEDGFGQALDVMAHEFTHCVTAAAMSTNLYQDDMGAINEAMSDIMGNLCEISLDATDDPAWLMGESSGMVVRSMTDPHAYQQPEYVWDLYYAPNAASPSEMNDYGGVHANSSILNRVAARLCLEEGMSPEEARDLWLTASLGMTPRTDYRQMAPLLRWALEVSGAGKHSAALERLIADSRMEETEAPAALPEGQRLVSLALPDTEAFRDPNWILMAVQLDTQEIGQRLSALWNCVKGVFDPDKTWQETLEEWQAVAARLHLDEVDLTLLASEDPESALLPLLSGLVNQYTTWQSPVDGKVSAVMKQCPTLYVLYNLSGEEETRAGAAVLLGNRWMDLGGLLLSDGLEAMDVENLAFELAGALLDRIPDLLEAKPEEGSVVELPTAGLEDVTLNVLELPDLGDIDPDAPAVDPDAPAAEAPEEA